MTKFVKTFRFMVKLHTYSIFTKQNICTYTTYNKILGCSVSATRSEALVTKWPCAFLCFRQYAKGGGKRQKAQKRKISLTDDEMMEVVDVHHYRNQLQALLDKMKSDLTEHLSIHTSASSIDTLPVEIGGEKYTLNELAQIARKKNLIAINMGGCPDGVKPAIQAIHASGLGLNPQLEGTMIYLPLPKVTRDLREKLSKNARTLFVKVKDDIRNIQNNFVKEAKGKSDMPEDLIFSTQQQLMAIADDFTSEAEKIMKIKQTELLGET